MATEQTLRKRILDFTKSGQRTLLYVGPVSVNCVDAVIELAQIHPVPLTFIASRRQIDAEAFGGGYVGLWRTPDYVAYIKERDKKNNIIIGRDHAGPWQNEDNSLDLNQAMASAKKSLAVDIEAGVQFLHLDCTIDPSGVPSFEQILSRICELHGYCLEVASRLKKEVFFEFGPFTMAMEKLDDPEFIEGILQRVADHCQKNNFPMPLNIVGNVGTKVMEIRNVGRFPEMMNSLHNGGEQEKLKRLIAVCDQYQVFLKEHNTDYLPQSALEMHPELGIHSANIAPELGVIETTELLTQLKRIDQSLYDEFVTLAVDSLKWQKWMLPGSILSTEEKAIIAGHYVYSHPKGAQIKQKAQEVLRKEGIELDEHLKRLIRLRVEFYMRCFRLIG